MAERENEALDPQLLYSKEYCIGTFGLPSVTLLVSGLTLLQEEVASEKYTKGISTTMSPA